MLLLSVVKARRGSICKAFPGPVRGDFPWVTSEDKALLQKADPYFC